VRDPVASFSGRAKELDQLHQALRRIEGEGKFTIRSRMTCISGLGGVGKSELARKYAFLYGQDYNHNVIWINAEKYETLIESFLRLTEKLRIPTKSMDGKQINIVSIVEEVYNYFAKKKSLFIFDNAEKYKTQDKEDGGIDSFLPSLPPDNKPYIMITSRNGEWPKNVKMLALDTFTEAEAAQFIRKALDIKDGSQESQVKELSQTLQRFPIALQQAVAYIKVENQILKNLNPQKEFKICDYLEEYSKRAEKLLDHPLDSDDSYTKTTLTTWQVTFDKIKDNKEYGQQALEIVNIIAYFAPDNIPTIDK